jgi:hypothetical protein
MKLLGVVFRDKLPFRTGHVGQFKADMPDYEIVVDASSGVPFVWVRNVRDEDDGKGGRRRVVLEEHGAPLANVASVSRAIGEEPKRKP